MVLPYPDPPLTDRVVLLRGWGLGDLGFVEVASSDPVLVAGTSLPSHYDEAEGRAFIERQWGRQTENGLSLAIVEAGEVVGCTTLMMRRPDIADLGYWLLASARGRGIGTRVVALLVPWALARIDAVEAFVDPGNVPSRRLLERAGFSEQGSRRHTFGRIDQELLVYRLERGG